MSDEATPRSGRWVWIARASALAGAGLVSFGAWLAWPPAGLMVCGSLLIVVGVGALRE